MEILDCFVKLCAVVIRKIILKISESYSCIAENLGRINYIAGVNIVNIIVNTPAVAAFVLKIVSAFFAGAETQSCALCILAAFSHFSADMLRYAHNVAHKLFGVGKNARVYHLQNIFS